VENGEYGKLIKNVKFSGQAYEAGSAIVEQLRAGTIQIGASGPYPASTAFAKYGDIVLLSNAANGGTELMVSANSPIKSVKDLKGQYVGVNLLGSTVDTMVRYNIIQAGLIPDKEVVIVVVSPGEQADELKRGQIAAMAAPAPWPSYVKVNADARPLLDWKQILNNGRYSAGSLYTTKKFAQAHPEFIRQFLAANKTITDRLNADRAGGDAQVLAVWSKITKKKLTPEVAKAAFATIEYTMKVDEPALQQFVDIAYKARILKKKANLKGFVFTLPRPAASGKPTPARTAPKAPAKKRNK
jgi:NitT/TauT family transport system substrate-binding protein